MRSSACAWSNVLYCRSATIAGRSQQPGRSFSCRRRTVIRERGQAADAASRCPWRYGNLLRAFAFAAFVFTELPLLFVLLGWRRSAFAVSQRSKRGEHDERHSAPIALAMHLALLFVESALAGSPRVCRNHLPTSAVAGKGCGVTDQEFPNFLPFEQAGRNGTEHDPC